MVFAKGPVRYWWVDDNVTPLVPTNGQTKALKLSSATTITAVFLVVSREVPKERKGKASRLQLRSRNRWPRPDLEPELTMPVVAISAVQESWLEKARASKPS